MRFIIADLTRKAIGFIVRHLNEENRGYLRHAGITVEEFMPPPSELDDRELEALVQYRRDASPTLP